jgi:peptidoglycan/LPS O-acetylase OafA/YrhL
VARSLGARLDELGGIGPGFDHLRVGLALAILLWHSFSISYGIDYARQLPKFPVPVLLGMLLPMFFGLSGFLVMGSALRTHDLKTFLTFRVLRIVPALFTEIVVSALVLGPLLTSLPLRTYFNDPRFIEYFGSLVGRVRFQLPGLFVDNPQPEYVNFALWTVGPEILCYLLLSLLILTGAYLRQRAMIAILLAAFALCLLSDNFVMMSGIGEVLPGRMLILAFLIGGVLFLYRHAIPFSLPLLLAALLVGLAFIGWRQVARIEAPGYCALPFLVYATASIGLLRLPKLPFFSRGDYSYGIYIYGFPIQQAVAHFLPLHRTWWINFALALPLTLGCAVLSWHYVEKPCLNLRRRFLHASPVAGRSTGSWHRAAAFVALSAYSLFVLDAAHVLPIRPLAKLIVYGDAMRGATHDRDGVRSRIGLCHSCGHR